MENTKKINKEKIYFVIKIIASCVLAGIFIYFLTDKRLYLDWDNENGVQFLNKIKIVQMAVMTVVCLAVVWVKTNFTPKVNKVLLAAVAFLSGIFNFVGMEMVSGDLSKIRHLVGLINPIVIIFLIMTIYAICNRMKPAIVTTTLIMYVFSVVNYFAEKFRGIPIIAADLSLAKTAASVAGEFEYQIDYNVLFYTMLVIFMFTILSKIPETGKITGRLRIGYLGGYAVVLACFLYAFVFSDTLERLNVDVQPFDPRRSYASNGSVLTFSRSCQLIRIEKPKGYEVEKLQAAADVYIKEYEEDTKEYKKPNVIVVMNEAFADVQSIHPFATNADVMPVINSLKENTIKGTAYASVFGGKTANSEYEVLTGHPTAFLNDVVPFQFLIKRPVSNLNTYLANLGYEGMTAIHPYLERGYNRNVAYKYLGFNDFISQEDLEGEHEYVRTRISDADAVRQVIAEYEKVRQTSDAPAYVYMVTMQNHSPWDEDYDNFNVDVEVTDEEYKTAEVERYLSLIKLSDASLGILIDYFSRIEEDTVVVFFGDHQPKLEKSYYGKLFGKPIDDLSREESLERYAVPYVIWANYDIEEKEYGDISLNYLSTIMMDAAGMKLSPYNRFLMDLYEEVPVFTVNGYRDKNGKFYEKVDEQSPYKDMLDLYEYTQYNNLMDSKNRVENFFD